jgi:hypothetical protein
MRPWLEVVDEARALPRWEALTRSGLAALDRARAAPGRVRQSAYHLLTADALLTYACEAALEDADPETTLRRILRSVGASPK